MAAVELATAYVALVPSAKGITSGINKELGAPLERAARNSGAKASTAFGNEMTSGIRGAAIKAAAAMTATFAAIKVAGLFKDAISEASDLNESISKVGAVFKETAPDIQEWATTASTAMGLSRQAALEAAGTFGNFLISMGNTEGPAAEMSKSLVGLASDIASFNNVDIDEALIALRSGLAGEAEPLRRFGVNLSAARIEAEGAAKGIHKVFNEMTGAEKSTLAFSIIMKDTALAQGDFARTSQGLANQQRILSAQWADAKAKIGELFLPAAVRAAQFMNTTLVPNIVAVVAAIGPAVTAFLNWKEALVSAVLPIFAELVGGVQAMISAIREPEEGLTSSGLAGRLEEAGLRIRAAFDQIVVSVDLASAAYNRHRDVILPLTAAVGAFAGTLLAVSKASSGIAVAQSALAAFGPAVGQALGPLLANPVGLIIAGIVAVGVAFVVAYQNIQPFREAVDNVASTVRDVAVKAFDRLSSVVETVGDTFATVRSAVADAFSSFAGRAQGAYRAIVRVLTPLAQWINDHVINVLSAAAGFFGALFDRIVDVLEPAIQTVQSVLGAIANIIVQTFGTLASLVSTALSTVAGVLSGFVSAALAPFSLAFEAVRLVVETVFNGITAVVQTVLDTIAGIFTTMEGVLRGDFSKIWEGLQEIVSAPLNAASEFVSETFDNIVGFVLDMPSRIETAAFGMFNGILDAFKSVINGIIEAWNNLSFTLPSVDFDWNGPLPGGDVTIGGFTLDTPDIPTLATGGLVMGPTLAFVGEVRPEVVAPLDELDARIQASLTAVLPAQQPATISGGRALHIEHLTVGSKADFPEVRANLKRLSLSSRP